MGNETAQPEFEWPTPHDLVKKTFPDSTPDGAEHAALIVLMEQRYLVHNQAVVASIIRDGTHEQRLILMDYARLTFNRDLAEKINIDLGPKGIRKTLTGVFGSDELKKMLNNPDTQGGHRGRYLKGEIVFPVEAPTTPEGQPPTPEEAIVQNVSANRHALQSTLNKLRDEGTQVI